MTAATSPTAPRWMSTVLWAAAIYNVVWGAWVILFPHALFRWAGVDPLPNYPEIWQCLGMVIGVYGIGYAIAASDPLRHWPIVLVGLLGKVLGPMGFLKAAATGVFPWKMGVTILTNDLIWWWPFLAILWGAIRARNVVEPALIGDPWRMLRDQNGRTMLELSQARPTLVVFLRHSGCTFCREALADLQSRRGTIEGAGVQIALVQMGSDADGAAMFSRYQLGDVPRFSDPDQALYRAFGLELGSFQQLLGLKTFWRGMKAALFQGHGFGAVQGNAFRMPGAFLIRDGEIVTAYRHRAASDRPDYTALACSLGPST